MTEEDVRQLLRDMCEASSQRVVARQLGVSEVLIHKVIKKGHTLGRKIPRAMGLVREVKYIPCGKGRNEA